jgi:hypothetical protein
MSGIAYFFMYKEKYQTKGHVVASGCPASCYFTEPRKIGKYLVFNAGSSCKTFPMEEGDFVLVVPRALVTWFDAIAVCNVQVTCRDIYKLPRAVRNEILRDKNLNQNCVYFGIFDKDTKLYGKPFYIKGLNKSKLYAYQDFEEDFCNLNMEDNITQDVADGVTTRLESQAGHMARINKTFNPKPKLTLREPPQQKDDYGETH